MRRVPSVEEQIGDIQALLRTPFTTLRRADYWLLHIVDVEGARGRLAALAGRIVHSADDVGRGSFKDEGAVIAFTWEGLRRLRFAESATSPFPTQYKSGQGSKLREDLLRDRPRDAWIWSDVDVDRYDAGEKTRFVAHVLVAHYYAMDSGARLANEFGDPCFRYILVEGDPDFFEDDNVREPFGFRDGLAQPLVPGLHNEKSVEAARAAAGPMWNDRVVAAGEFVLGQVNQYGEIACCPDGTLDGDRPDGSRVPFGQNGTYLAVRQISQDVERFRAFEAGDEGTPVPAGCPFPAAPTIVEKMMGRMKDGRALSWRPGLPGEPDAFRFLENDAEGFQCPRGAHIRRANPRDSLGVDVESGVAAAKLHRLLRRGRAYIDRSDPHDVKQGTFFIACNADLDRQFEFVQQRWIGNPRFGGNAAVLDPILGQGGRRQKHFKMSGLPLGTEVSGFGDFTTTLGAGYFFLPGLNALRYLLDRVPMPAQDETLTDRIALGLRRMFARPAKPDTRRAGPVPIDRAPEADGRTAQGGGDATRGSSAPAGKPA